MRFGRDQRGVTAPEFAVACGVVLMLVMATIDFGVLLMTEHAVNYGLIAAARYAVVNAGVASQTTIQSKFKSAVTSALGATRANACSVTASFPSGNVVGGTVLINASCPWTPGAAGLDKLVPITIAASDTLTIQH